MVNLPTGLVQKIEGSYAEAQQAANHLHNRERWFGKLAVQTATDWGEEAGLTPYRAISGNADFGSDPNDEALVLGTDDTPAIAGKTLFDPHRLVVIDQSVVTVWVLRLIYGTGTMSAAEAAGQYSDVMIIANSAITILAGGAPFNVILPRLNCGVDKLWVRAKNATNNATIDFFMGIHEYLK